MGFDEGLLQRIEEAIERLNPEFNFAIANYDGKKMFGGYGVMFRGNMGIGILGPDIIVRVGPDPYEELLKEPGVRVFDFTGKPMRGWIVVASEYLAEDDGLDNWLKRGIRFAMSLPAK